MIKHILLSGSLALVLAGALTACADPTAPTSQARPAQNMSAGGGVMIGGG